MKIKSNIQKIFAVLLLSVLAISCTDEMMDGGGKGTPVEEGLPVNVKLMLDMGDQQTVETRSTSIIDKDGKTEKSLLFLQYKEEEGEFVLKYAFHVRKGLQGDPRVNDISDLKLLSGSNYLVFVITNFYENNLEPPRNDNSYDGIVDFENNNTFMQEFGTLSALSSWRRETARYATNKNSYGGGSPNKDKDILFGVVSSRSEKNKDGNYTPMITDYSNLTYETTINQSCDINKIKTDYLVTVKEDKSLYATLYPPYSQVTLNIKADSEFKSTLKINSVKLYNYPKDYSLFSGLVEYGKADDEEMTELTKFKSQSITSNTITPISSDPVLVYENMAGTVDNKKFPFGENSDFNDDPKASAAPYTYIKVEGDLDGKSIVYRFILGKDEMYDCNVERNVHYNVTMTLYGDGKEPTWRVVSEPDIEVDEDSEKELSALDAHASWIDIKFTNVKSGGVWYHIVVDKQEKCNTNYVNWDANADTQIKPVKGYTYNDNGGGFRFENAGLYELKLYAPKDGSLPFYKFIAESPGEYTLRYRQLSWFDYNKDKAEHQVNKAQDVAKAEPNVYYLHVFEGRSQDLGTEKLTIKIIQYPPIVVTNTENSTESSSFASFTLGDNTAYRERFNDDHKASYTSSYDGNNWQKESSLGTPWKKETPNDRDDDSYYKYMFNIETGSSGHFNSESYWANLHGALNSNNRVTGSESDAKNEPERQGWPFVVAEQPTDGKIYITDWQGKNN
ncbi:hypothetical protein [Parabacteroides sp.]